MAARYILLVAAALFSSSVVLAYKEELKKTISSCQNGAPVTDEEIEEFVKPMIPQTDEEKCLMACVFKAFNVISDGNFNKQIALAVGKDMFKNDPEKVEKIIGVVNHCGDDIPKDMKNECDLAHEIMQCYVKWEKEVGLLPKS